MLLEKCEMFPLKSTKHKPTSWNVEKWMKNRYIWPPKTLLKGKLEPHKNYKKLKYGVPQRKTFLGGQKVVKMHFFPENDVGLKNYFNFEGFFKSINRVNSGIPNDRIFQHTILELSYKLDSKNMCNTFFS